MENRSPGRERERRKWNLKDSKLEQRIPAPVCLLISASSRLLLLFSVPCSVTVCCRNGISLILYIIKAENNYRLPKGPISSVFVLLLFYVDDFFFNP